MVNKLTDKEKNNIKIKIELMKLQLDLAHHTLLNDTADRTAQSIGLAVLSLAGISLLLQTNQFFGVWAIFLIFVIMYVFIQWRYNKREKDSKGLCLKFLNELEKLYNQLIE